MLRKSSKFTAWKLQELRSDLRWLAKSLEGSQIVELAVGLPFLMVLIVGIFDFGQAFNTKQKVNTAAREGARFASNQSTLDWSDPNAPTVLSGRNVVSAYLVNSRLTDCGLLTASPSYDATSHTWTFSSKGSCPTNLVLVIQRANTFQMSNGTNLVATKVTLTYPLQWHFSSVVKLIAPDSNYGGPVFTITSNAVMANLT